MDLLQAALIFLIFLLSIFLAITGVQVFYILRDLKKALDRLNKVLKTGEEIATEIEKPVAAAANLVNALGSTAKAAGTVASRVVSEVVKKSPRLHAPKKRFYKKVL